MQNSEFKDKRHFFGQLRKEIDQFISVFVDVNCLPHHLDIYQPLTIEMSRKQDNEHIKGYFSRALGNYDESIKDYNKVVPIAEKLSSDYEARLKKTSQRILTNILRHYDLAEKQNQASDKKTNKVCGNR